MIKRVLVSLFVVVALQLALGQGAEAQTGNACIGYVSCGVYSLWEPDLYSSTSPRSI